MKALWSYEPFHQDLKRIRSMHQALGQLSGSPSDINVGFIANHLNTNLALAFDVPKDKRFGDYPKAQIKKELKAGKIKISDSRIHVVEYQTYSTAKTVDQMLNVASDNDCKIIGIFTHARQGYRRLVMGSFAETAIHRSKVDLLLLNPKVEIEKQFRNMLFASDFGTASRTEFSKIFRYVKCLGADLTVFHHAEAIYKTSFDEENPRTKEYRKKIDRMKSWIENAAVEHGIKVSIVIAADISPTVSQILRVAQKSKADIIAVSAKTGPLLALMGGSVTRQIARESLLPVLIMKTRGG